MSIEKCSDCEVGEGRDKITPASTFAPPAHRGLSTSCARGFLHAAKEDTDGNIASNRMFLPALDMKKNPSDLALLESALSTIELVLARADSDMQGARYLGPTTNLPLDLVPEPDPEAGDSRFRTSAAQSAINLCLGSAAALIDVSQALMNRSMERSPETLEREWQAMITHTTNASRSIYRAALIMAAQKHVLAAQGESQSDNLYGEVTY